MSKSKGSPETRVVIGEPVDADELRSNGEAEPYDLVDAPKIGSPRWGTLGKVWRIYRIHQKERKYADRGYVKWYLVGSGWPSPKFVKPAAKGGGIPQYEHDGVTYVFPRRAMLPDRESGMQTVVHKENEAEPVVLSDPTEYAIKADELGEYLTKIVTSSPPSFWDKFDFDAQDLLYYAIGAVILVAVLQQALGGGM